MHTVATEYRRLMLLSGLQHAQFHAYARDYIGRYTTAVISQEEWDDAARSVVANLARVVRNGAAL